MYLCAHVCMYACVCDCSSVSVRKVMHLHVFKCRHAGILYMHKYITPPMHM